LYYLNDDQRVWVDYHKINIFLPYNWTIGTIYLNINNLYSNKYKVFNFKNNSLRKNRIKFKFESIHTKSNNKKIPF